MRADISQLGFLATHHKIENIDDFCSADVRFFIYRDPFERVVSLFQNKLIMCAGNTDVFRDYKRVTGKYPAEATFTDFVFDYLDIEVDVLDLIAAHNTAICSRCNTHTQFKWTIYANKSPLSHKMYAMYARQTVLLPSC